MTHNTETFLLLHYTPWPKVHLHSVWSRDSSTWSLQHLPIYKSMYGSDPPLPHGSLLEMTTAVASPASFIQAPPPFNTQSFIYQYSSVLLHCVDPFHCCFLQTLSPSMLPSNTPLTLILVHSCHMPNHLTEQYFTLWTTQQCTLLLQSIRVYHVVLPLITYSANTRDLS